MCEALHKDGAGPCLATKLVPPLHVGIWAPIQSGTEVSRTWRMHSRKAQRTHAGGMAELEQPFLSHGAYMPNDAPFFQLHRC